MSGYQSAAYARAFRELGEVITLPESGLPLIRRAIRPGLCDLVGLYPYSMCRDFAALESPADRAALAATGAVSVTFVADPFAAAKVRAALGGWDLCRRFKTHFVIDLASDWRAARRKTIRYEVRRGYEEQRVEIVAGSPEWAERFAALYEASIRRLGITGIARLSPDIIAGHMAVPGLFLAVSRIGDIRTGMLMGFVQDGHANFHLIAVDEAHRAARTSPVLIDAAAAHAERLGCRWFNLGGPAGMDDDPEDGLYNFKRRWTPHRRETMLCGKVLDRAAHDALCAGTGTQGAAFFPAYRAPGSPLEWLAARAAIGPA